MDKKTNEIYDVVVVGGGAMGLATAYQLGKRSTRTLVLEQFSFVNQLGSSAGVSRQFRIPYPDQYMVDMARNSLPYWDELQKHTSKTLLEKVGTLWFGDPNVHSTEGNIAEAEKALQASKVPYESLTVQEIENRYHFKNLPTNYTGLFQPDGASIDFKATIETLLDLCIKDPLIELQEETPVNSIVQEGDLFIVTTPNGVFTTKKMVVVPGPYINNVINMFDFTIDALYWNMSSAYFKKSDPNIKYPTWFVFQEAIEKNGNQFYGFPEVDWDRPGYIRVAPDFVLNPVTNPKDRSLIPNEEELQYTSNWVRDHMTGLEIIPEFKSTCLVALSTFPNKELIIDFAPPTVPNNKNIVLYATGWAAKFTPYLGKILSDMILDGKTDFDITPFKLES